MKYNNKENSKFNKLIRIKESQLLWLRQNKKNNKCRTMAGLLDKIISKYKKNENRKTKKA